MSNKKFKLNLDPDKLITKDFDGHALKDNLLCKVKGGFLDQIFMQAGSEDTSDEGWDE